MFTDVTTTLHIHQIILTEESYMRYITCDIYVH